MAQQTAIEWLVKTIGNAYKEGIFEQHFCKDIEQAKQMEKEQIIIAHGEKSQFGFDSSGNYFSNKKTGEQYFNETYGE